MKRAPWEAMDALKNQADTIEDGFWASVVRARLFRERLVERGLEMPSLTEWQ